MWVWLGMGVNVFDCEVIIIFFWFGGYGNKCCMLLWNCSGMSGVL